MKAEQLYQLAKKHNLDFLFDEQADAEALTALIEEAVMLGGEVMRRQCANHISATDWLFANKSNPKAARYHVSLQARALQAVSLNTLPGVTFDDTTEAN